MKPFVLSLILVLYSSSLLAQPKPSEETARIVAQVTEAFFEQLTKDDPASERAFMADHFAQQMTAERWNNARQETIELIGPTPRYRATNLTFYEERNLLAAVDFLGQTSNNYVCGYVVWEFSGENSLGFIRLEQNIVDPQVFRTMENGKAAQTLIEWRCPPEFVEDLLGIKLRRNSG